MTADEKILALIKPEYLERVPRMFRGHATKTTVKKRLLKSIDLYAKSEVAGDLPDEATQELSIIINGIFEVKIKKHNSSKFSISGSFLDCFFC
ncbi:hypothetical protein [Streptococcus sobrinus]|uniref:hypothetical protein n=1 Tax=Streptococcus sobrinus TaxID=1310 RepID=UPI0002D885E0|nr:hypothetical protein [Streptococcus sobrinus]